ncbi:ATP-binding protein (plasmid) [Enterobacter asburiae]|jgi:predicted ATPase|uniref:ATP-dependent nuclease n=2 Tax=Enterobacter TaxID=547 RepID=UPI00079B9B2B|nr:MULTISPECIES: ATP-binding protein [Enterobacter cloacae complex]MCK6717789.1 ATP-binding protein [Enterobacter roggenkampii]MDH1654756.1 ATP-binding protein [Enterobacter roggenkampii]PRW42480.1 AAA domain protein [Enterobacter roggenkampii]UOZ20265.1 ATP-binding protein [Enterobacter asburiae]SAG97236.1 Predicted ATP-binding protein involved in virulence [Enterobacter hormaechei]
MAISKEMRKLINKWKTGTSWPKRLEWLEIKGIRGWSGQRVDFQFPIVALVGENGSGKSTVLQCAASVYKDKKKRFASFFFPDTPFEKIQSAYIRYSYREGHNSLVKSIRKPTNRWIGNPDRPARRVEYVDLSRLQPVNARLGYLKLLKGGSTEQSHEAFDQERLDRLKNIIGKSYTAAGLSTTTIDAKRPVTVISNEGTRYSGFHQGAGEITATELIAVDYPKYGLILIDEIETSLHPRAQRRLMRDLANLARERELQILITTHSPYILSELPPEARIYLMNGVEGKTAVSGVSPEFAMTKMDEENHPECDVYVEDVVAKTLVSEVIASSRERELLSRVMIIPFGTASVGMALGQMAHNNRFPRTTVVYLDGDQSPAQGCTILPGDDAPEVVVFNALQEQGWPNISEKIGREPAETIDALNASMSSADHHGWPRAAANSLNIGSEILWHAMCSSWAKNCMSSADLDAVLQPIVDALESER